MDNLRIISSHVGQNWDIKVVVNDVKRMAIPDTTGWRINPAHLKSALEQFDIDEARAPQIRTEFNNLDEFISGLVRSNEEVFFVIPAWPGASSVYRKRRRVN